MANVVIISPSRDELNTNHLLRSHVVEGFSQALGPSTGVYSASAPDAVDLIENSKPRLVVAFGSIYPDDNVLRAVRSSCDEVGAHLAAWLHDDPYELDFGYQADRLADTVFTNESAAVEYYEQAPSFHLPLAASPTKHFRPIKERFDYDLSFCGFAYDNRIRFIQDFLALEPRMRLAILGAGWPETSPSVRNIRLDNEQLCDLYARSAFVLNLGRDLDLANQRFQVRPSTPGPRTFEAAMAGSAQLYFVSSLEIAEYFEPDREIILIDQPVDIVSAYDALASDPDALHQIRVASQRRVMRDHTYAVRARKLLESCASHDQALARLAGEMHAATP